MSAVALARLDLYYVVGEGRQVELPAGGVDVAVQLGALTDQTQAHSQQVTESASFFGVGVGQREVSDVIDAARQLSEQTLGATEPTLHMEKAA